MFSILYQICFFHGVHFKLIVNTFSEFYHLTDNCVSVSSYFEIVAPIDAHADPVLHTCQTVGRLSNKVARRVYRTVSRQVKLLKKEDVQEYVASLIAVLRLTQYLNFINEKVQAGQSSGAVVDSENERNGHFNKQQQHKQQPSAQNNHEQ